MLYVISGCSGGGKTTLVDALAALGFDTSEEPGRRIVRVVMNNSGDALPWKNSVAFSEKCAEISVQNYQIATKAGRVNFFDRSLVDAVSSLVHEQPDRAEAHLRKLDTYRYSTKVFMSPPWPEIFKNDTERRHGFTDAVEEYDRLVSTYTMADYSILLLPKSSVAERIEFVLKHIE